VRVPGATAGSTTWRTVHGTLTEARNERRACQAAAREAVPHASQHTVRTWCAHWFSTCSPSWRASTVKGRSNTYRLHVDPYLGDVPLTELTRERVQLWVNELRDALPRDGFDGHRALELAYQVLRAMLNTAVEDDVIASNPVLKAKLPPKPPALRGSRKVIDRDQLARLIAAASNLREHTLLRCAAEGGLRRGELAGLRWSDIDLERCRITVNRSLWQGKEAGRVVTRDKGDSSRRALDTVAITSDLADALRRYRAQQARTTGSLADAPVWPGRGARAKGRARTHDEHMSPSSLTHTHARLMRKAGLVDSGGKPLVSLHGLRHTAASIPLADGVPLINVSAQLRHTKVTTTANHYSHLLGDDQLDRVSNAFEPRDTTTDGGNARGA
jgi:integrase